jgi:copper(I)-binding protein
MNVSAVRRLGIAAAVAASLLTSACAAGRHAQTAQERATLDGTYASVGSIDLRGLAIAAPSGPSYPAGSAVTVKLVLINSSTGRSAKSDTLVGISSPAFNGWAAYPTIAAAQAATSGPTSAASSSSSGNVATSPPATQGESISAAPSVSTTPSAGGPVTSVPIGPGQRISWGVPEATGALVLTGAKRAIYPGSTIPITFSFTDAGAVTVAVPVQITSSPATSVLPAPSGSGAA